MAKDFSKAFYSSKTWQNTRNAYVKSVGGLCEDCMQHGIYTAGVIVHHIEELTPNNIHNPEVALSFKNLKLVCRDCHAKEHGAKQKRYKVGADGKPIII